MKHIDKSKISWFCREKIALVLAFATTAVSISICEGSGVIHTREICPICKYDTRPVEGRDDGLTMGILHQMDKIEEYYEEKYDTDVRVEYVSDKTKIVPANHYIDENGNEYHFAPAGYSLQKIDGVYYGVKEYDKNSIVAYSDDFLGGPMEFARLKLK